MRTLSVITTFPTKEYNTYAKRMLESFILNWPDDVKLYIYYEDIKPDLESKKFVYVNTHEVNPDLVAFKERHKNDPVANGELQEIPGGVRRLNNAGWNDRGKGSYLWDAPRFAHKTFCVDHALKTIDTDLVLWLDADTYTFQPIPKEFVLDLLPSDPPRLLNYLGRGDLYPECGWVCYNRRHPKIKKFMETWTNLYKNDTIFQELEWHDSYLFWQMIQRVAPNECFDIGGGVGTKGHHVFVNSRLGEFIDHLKGKRKAHLKSSSLDLQAVRSEKYWQNIENYNPLGGSKQYGKNPDSDDGNKD